jgi:hypothetical protein
MDSSNDKDKKGDEDKQLVKSSKRKTLVFRDIEDASDRLF